MRWSQRDQYGIGVRDESPFRCDDWARGNGARGNGAAVELTQGGSALVYRSGSRNSRGRAVAALMSRGRGAQVWMSRLRSQQGEGVRQEAARGSRHTLERQWLSLAPRRAATVEDMLCRTSAVALSDAPAR